jgi:iron-sulfur cluster repair protein YtfE (RIC family)
LNAIELLKHDHAEVTQLFQHYQSTKQRQTGDSICRELEVHAAIEEQIFYPAAQQKGGELQRMIEEGIQEHSKAKSTINELKSTQDDGQYATKMQDLQHIIEHHVQEEEGHMFPTAQSEMGAELEQLGSRMEQLKHSLKAGV